MPQPDLDPQLLAEEFGRRLREVAVPVGGPHLRDEVRESLRRELLDILRETSALPADAGPEGLRRLDEVLGLPAGHMDLIQRSVRSALDYEKLLDELLEHLGK
jgi:hypothetical protein